MERAAIIANRRREGPFEKRLKGTKTKTLNITSLIDILTILLIFMLKNVAMDASPKSAPEGMLLPTTISKDELIENGHTVYVKIYTDKILYGTDNIVIGTLEDFMTKPEIRSSLLGNLREEADLLLAQDNEPCLLIQGDKNLDCKYITEFIKFSGQAKFANIYFSTIHTDDKKEILGL